MLCRENSWFSWDIAQTGQWYFTDDITQTQKGERGSMFGLENWKSEVNEWMNEWLIAASNRPKKEVKRSLQEKNTQESFHLKCLRMQSLLKFIFCSLSTKLHVWKVFLKLLNTLSRSSEMWDKGFPIFLKWKGGGGFYSKQEEEVKKQVSSKCKKVWIFQLSRLNGSLTIAATSFFFSLPFPLLSSNVRPVVVWSREKTV